VAHVRVALELTGAGVGPSEQQRCLEAVRQAGGVADAQAPLHALVTLEPNGNRVQLLSNRRGLVHDQLEPQASVEALCREAVAAATTEARHEPLPAPAGAEQPPTARIPTNPMSSGAPSGAPISE
jgi:hypothetical protein